MDSALYATATALPAKTTLPALLAVLAGRLPNPPQMVDAWPALVPVPPAMDYRTSVPLVQLVLSARAQGASVALTLPSAL